MIRFLRFTGWRVTEALGLTWDRVDWEGAVIRLTAADTKGKQARVFPFGWAPDLKAILDAQWQVRDGAFVFHHDGRSITYDALEHQCDDARKRVGLAGRIIHDLRRTAARDLRRAGVGEGDIMKLCGWKTRAMFDRYNIIDEDDLAAAVAKRFANGQVTAKWEGAGATAERLSSSAVTREG